MKSDQKTHVQVIPGVMEILRLPADAHLSLDMHAQRTGPSKTLFHFIGLFQLPWFLGVSLR
jgi:hypothetical protein